MEGNENYSKEILLDLPKFQEKGIGVEAVKEYTENNRGSKKGKTTSRQNKLVIVFPISPVKYNSFVNIYQHLHACEMFKTMIAKCHLS